MELVQSRPVVHRSTHLTLQARESEAAAARDIHIVAYYEGGTATESWHPRRKVMHDALLISEVLTRIFDYLAEDTVRYSNAFYPKDTGKAGRRALTALARSCRTFSEPALDALWRRLHDLKPFVLCLPIKALHDDTKVDGALPPFDEEEWKVVLRYAPRVQELTLEYQLSVKILQSLWFRTTLLLPNLRKLHWIYQDYTVIGSIRLLLSPSLVHLHVWLDSGDHSSVLGLLESYHTLCPNLKSLYIGHLSHFPHVTSAISRAITRSPNLESLSCDPIDEVALIHVAESRFLKQLRVSLLKYRPENLARLASYGSSDHPPFENLRLLRLRIDDISLIFPCLRAHHQPFEEVSLDLRVLPEPEVLYEFFAALSSATRRATLQRIKLLFIGLARYTISSRPVDLRVFSPLMTFNLHRFDFDLHNLISLNDDELAQLVQAWPELETFYFNQQGGWEYLPSTQVPTLRGLLLLLARCPKLRHLGMCVDARNIPPLTEDESLIRNTAVKTLSLANSPIQGPAARIARFLLKHFPSLIALPAWKPFDGQPSHEGRHMWREVNTLIQEITGRGSPESSESEMQSDSETEIV